MTTTQRVKAILEYSTAARNSDTALQIIYMQKAGMKLSPEQIETFRKLPSMETIRRIRQKLQESGKYTASPNIASQRRAKGEAIQQAIPTLSPEGTEYHLTDERTYRITPWGRG